MKRLILTSTFVSALLLLSHFAVAHTDEYLATVEAPHGGQLRAAGPFHLELVAEDGELTLYVTDHGDNPISTAGGLGKANIQVGKDGERKSVVLEPVYGNIMKGKGDFKITPDTSIAVFLGLPGFDTQGANFSAQKHIHHHHHHHHHDEKDGDEEGGSKDNDE